MVEWLPVFIDETACRIVTDSLNFCINHKYLRVNAYVIMPTHFHAILFDIEFNSEQLKHTLDDMRKFTGCQMLDSSAQRLLKSFADVFKQYAGEDRQRRFWQSTQHPVGIFSEKVWKQKMDYLHYNPCRKGLVLRPEVGGSHLRCFGRRGRKMMCSGRPAVIPRRGCSAKSLAERGRCAKTHADGEDFALQFGERTNQ